MIAAESRQAAFVTSLLISVLLYPLLAGVPFGKHKVHLKPADGKIGL